MINEWYRKKVKQYKEGQLELTLPINRFKGRRIHSSFRPKYQMSITRKISMT